MSAAASLVMRPPPVPGICRGRRRPVLLLLALPQGLALWLTLGTKRPDTLAGQVNRRRAQSLEHKGQKDKCDLYGWNQIKVKPN